MRKLGWRAAAVGWPWPWSPPPAGATTTTPRAADEGAASHHRGQGRGGPAGRRSSSGPSTPAGRITKAALREGDIQMALLFSSDADIAENDWVSLEDDKELQQLENLTPAIRADKRDRRRSPRPSTRSRPSSPPRSYRDEPQELRRRRGPGRRGQAVAGGQRPAALRAATRRRAALRSAPRTSPSRRSWPSCTPRCSSRPGVQVTRKFQLGNREMVAPALEKGDIDLYPEYLGTYLLFIDESTTVPPTSEAADELQRAARVEGHHGAGPRPTPRTPTPSS